MNFEVYRMNITITRFAYTRFGTFGEMFINGVRLLTVENPWMNNKPVVSCIPTGEYRIAPRRFYRGGYESMEVCDVPGRSHILFHRGNTMKDTAGCILVTEREGYVNGMWAGINSRQAFALFMENVGGDEHILNIVNASQVGESD